jgi:hypothetical protein
LKVDAEKKEDLLAVMYAMANVVRPYTGLKGIASRTEE